MSEESTTPNLIELGWRFREALNRRDFDEVESLYASDAVLRGAEIGTFDGAAAIRALHEDLVRPYEEFHCEVEALDLGNGVGLYVGVFEGRPLGSTRDVCLRLGFVVNATDGLIERQTNYADIDEARAAAEALADLGLEE